MGKRRESAKKIRIFTATTTKPEPPRAATTSRASKSTLIKDEKWRWRVAGEEVGGKRSTYLSRYALYTTKILLF